ncbi:6-phospho-beta-glucosidase gmuD [uncultured Clostridium sp.]|uniref:glycoside hydrolase family 1 protein n=1 Tax=uncultured Clostridium sp. TaxID=59620 RepID=UPI000820510E|nr:glycoside hydrolase family 1 protein [uncultured Clostridium sp.]SCI76382.1 6-phospho-beta-glucosidase gmuD [uncultured Clostridium sp.]
MAIYKFPENFTWGAATSGPQTEGWTDKGNFSIYEHWFQIEPEKFHNGVGPAVNCDTYRKYKEDVKLMKEIGLTSFRTSIQWTRLIKNFDTCEVDPVAVGFYNNYINEIIEAGIEPYINLFHFDMPIELQNRGGWESKEVVDLYVKYATKCFELFGDRVKKWCTFNEPIVPAEGGYLYKFMYPNISDFKRAIQVGYNTIVAHAKAVEAFRKLNTGGEITIVLNLTPSYPRSEDKKDLEASRIADGIFNRSFLDPVVHGNFPEDVVELFKNNDLLPEYTEEELEVIKNNPIDFLGVNYYQPRRVKAKETEVDSTAPIMPENFFDYYDMPGKRMNPYRGWEIAPQVMYDVAINIRDNYNNIPWYISENGMGVEGEERFRDENGVINDDYRIDFVKEHLTHLHKGIEEGSNCFGYHLWTFIDCWSWANSFKNRYGFVSLDLETGKRTIKKSGRWIREVSETNQFEY